MRVLILIILGTGLLLGISVAYLWGKRDDPGYFERLLDESRALVRLTPSEEERALTLSRAERTGVATSRITAGSALLGDLPVATVAESALIRTSLGLAVAPFMGAAFLIGAFFGLLRRERIREEFAFASLTASYLAKLLVGISILAYIVTSFSPVGPPIWALYVAVLLTGAGAAIYFGNLPPKL